MTRSIVSRFVSNPHLPAASRFWARVDKNGPEHPTLGRCWVWRGQACERGYGRLRVNGMTTGAHRYSYILSGGSVPNSLWVLHHCDNPRCVNPEHLFVGDCKANVDDKVAKDRQYRPSGELNVWAILTEEQVREIRRRYKAKCRVNGERALAREFNVCNGTIYCITSGRSWGHLE